MATSHPLEVTSPVFSFLPSRGQQSCAAPSLTPFPPFVPLIRLTHEDPAPLLGLKLWSRPDCRSHPGTKKKKLYGRSYSYHIHKFKVVNKVSFPNCGGAPLKASGWGSLFSEASLSLAAFFFLWDKKSLFEETHRQRLVPVAQWWSNVFSLNHYWDVLPSEKKGAVICY